MEGRVDFDDKLLPNEHLAIYGGNLKRSDQIRFSFLNLDENRQLLVPEKKKVYLRNFTCFRLEISYFRISRISIQSDRILQLQIFSRKIICPIRLFKTKIFKFNCITEMFILKIFLFFFSTSLFKNLKIPFLIDQHCLENLFHVSGGIRCSISNRSQEDESEERREIELLPCGFDQTYVG